MSGGYRLIEKKVTNIRPEIAFSSYGEKKEENPKEILSALERLEQQAASRDEG